MFCMFCIRRPDSRVSPDLGKNTKQIKTNQKLAGMFCLYWKKNTPNIKIVIDFVKLFNSKQSSNGPILKSIFF